MIIGQINSDREAEISLPIRSFEGEIIEVEAVIDTGFTDFLTLPPDLVTSLHLTFRESAEFVLADGNLASFETYAATVVWDGQEKTVLLLASEGGPLIGMSLLYGYRVIMDVIDGGSVVIEPRV